MEVHPKAWPLPEPVLNTSIFDARDYSVHPAVVAALGEPKGGLGTADGNVTIPTSVSPGSFQMVPTPNVVSSINTSPDQSRKNQSGLIDHMMDCADPDEMLDVLLEDHAQRAQSPMRHSIASPRVRQAVQKIESSPPRGKLNYVKTSRSNSIKSAAKSDTSNSTTLRKQVASLQAQLTAASAQGQQSSVLAHQAERAWVEERTAHKDDVDACLRQGQALANYAAKEIGSAVNAAEHYKNQAETIQNNFVAFVQESQASSEMLKRVASEEVESREKCETELVAYQKKQAETQDTIEKLKQAEAYAAYLMNQLQEGHQQFLKMREEANATISQAEGYVREYDRCLRSCEAKVEGLSGQLREESNALVQCRASMSASDSQLRQDLSSAQALLHTQNQQISEAKWYKDDELAKATQVQAGLAQEVRKRESVCMTMNNNLAIEKDKVRKLEKALAERSEADKEESNEVKTVPPTVHFSTAGGEGGLGTARPERASTRTPSPSTSNAINDAVRKALKDAGVNVPQGGDDGDDGDDGGDDGDDDNWGWEGEEEEEEEPDEFHSTTESPSDAKGVANPKSKVKTKKKSGLSRSQNMSAKKCKDIKLPPILHSNLETREWVANIGTALIAASGYCDQREMDWVGEVIEGTFENLGGIDCGGQRYIQLDADLTIQLLGQVTKQVKTRYKELNKVAWDKKDKDGRRGRVTARQLMWLILDSFKTQREITPYFTMRQLYEMKWFGDNKVQEWVQAWTDLLATQKVRPKEDELRDIVHGMVETSDLFKHELILYNKARQAWLVNQKESPEYTYKYLMDAIHMHIYDTREKAAKAKQDAALARLTNPNHKAAPAKETKQTGDADIRSKSQKKRDKERVKKALAAKEGKEVPPPPPAPVQPRVPKAKPKPAAPAKVEQKKWCYYHNQKHYQPDTSKGCKTFQETGKCNFDHRLVSKAEFEAAKPPNRSRPSSVASSASGKGRGRGRGKGKGKGKGRGKGKDGKKGEYAAPAQSSGSDKEGKAPKNYKDFNTYKMKDGKRVPYFCHQYLKEKKCDNLKSFGSCQYHHWEQADIDKRSGLLNAPNFRPKPGCS